MKQIFFVMALLLSTCLVTCGATINYEHNVNNATEIRGIPVPDTTGLGVALNWGIVLNAGTNAWVWVDLTGGGGGGWALDSAVIATIVDDSGFTRDALPLAGGTMSGTIILPSPHSLFISTLFSNSGSDLEIGVAGQNDNIDINGGVAGAIRIYDGSTYQWLFSNNALVGQNSNTISGATWNGTAIADAYIANDITLTNLSQISDATEAVQDIVGAMLAGNTETGITVTYQDGDGTIDFIVSGGSGFWTFKNDYDTLVYALGTDSLIFFNTALGWVQGRENLAVVDSLEVNEFVRWFNGADTILMTHDLIDSMVTQKGVFATGGSSLPLSGGTMTGNIAFSSTQTVDGVDISTIPSTYIPFSGGTLTGGLNLNTNNIQSVSRLDADTTYGRVLRLTTNGSASDDTSAIIFNHTLGGATSADSIFFIDNGSGGSLYFSSSPHFKGGLSLDNHIFTNLSNASRYSYIYTYESGSTVGAYMVYDTLNNYHRFSGAINTSDIYVPSTDFDVLIGGTPVKEFTVSATGIDIPSGNITVSGTVDGVDLSVLAGRFDTNYTQITLNSVLGAVNVGGATSLEIPNGVNPLTDATGEIAFDSDDFALEVFTGTVSALIPVIQTKEFTVWSPDGITDTIPIWEIDSVQIQGGVVITNVSLLTSVDGAYTLQLFSFTSADPPVLHDEIDTLITGASDQFISSSIFQDLDATTLDVGQRLYVLTPATDIDWIKVKVRYYIKDNN